MVRRKLQCEAKQLNSCVTCRRVILILKKFKPLSSISLWLCRDRKYILVRQAVSYGPVLGLMPCFPVRIQPIFNRLLSRNSRNDRRSRASVASEGKMVSFILGTFQIAEKVLMCWESLFIDPLECKERVARYSVTLTFDCTSNTPIRSWLEGEL